MIRCSRCKRWKDPTMFWKHRKAVNGRQSRCISCAKAARLLTVKRQRVPIGAEAMDRDVFWGQVDATAIRRHRYSGRV